MTYVDLNDTHTYDIEATPPRHELRKLPASLPRSLTWDRGQEMARPALEHSGNLACQQIVPKLKFVSGRASELPKRSVLFEPQRLSGQICSGPGYLGPSLIATPAIWPTTSASAGY
jgi:hypothetical protein